MPRPPKKSARTKSHTAPAARTKESPRPSSVARAARSKKSSFSKKSLRNQKSAPASSPASRAADLLASPAETHFTPAAIKFLRSLARNNRREWFQPRKDIFLAEIRSPMLALIEELCHRMSSFAPDHVRQRERILMRIYRDTRFSADKSPYKKRLGAWFAHRKCEKTSGAGFYFHIAKDNLHIAAGAFMPDPPQLLAVRNYLLDHHAEFRRAFKSAQRLMPDIENLQLSRPPKGFSRDHPAQDLIRCREWGVSVSLPIAAALKPTLPAEIIRHFRAAAPLIALLNKPILAAAAAAPKPAPNAAFHPDFSVW